MLNEECPRACHCWLVQQCRSGWRLTLLDKPAVAPGAEHGGARRQENRPQPHHAALHDRVEQRSAPPQREVDEIDEDDRVAGNDARQGDHADHAGGREIDRIEVSAHLPALRAFRSQKPGITPRIVSGMASITTIGTMNEPVCATNST